MRNQSCSGILTIEVKHLKVFPDQLGKPLLVSKPALGETELDISAAIQGPEIPGWWS